jgi:hypothetical protein
MLRGATGKNGAGGINVFKGGRATSFITLN